MKITIKTPDRLLKPVFKLQKASVRGKAVLKSMPSHWQQLEEAHVIERALKTQTSTSQSKNKA